MPVSGLIKPAVPLSIPHRVGSGWPRVTVPWAALATAAVTLGAWEAFVRLMAIPAFLLPAPSRVAATLLARWPVIWPDALVTGFEMIGGLAVGTAAGVAAALLMAGSRAAHSTS